MLISSYRSMFQSNDNKKIWNNRRVLITGHTGFRDLG